MQPTKLRGIRGANVVAENSKQQIFQATKELVQVMISSNEIDTNDMAAIYFTLTPDLNAAFPAEAVRELGITSVPLLCMQEIDVPKSMPKVVRILILVNTHLLQNEIKHIFIGKAKQLRDDLNDIKEEE